MKALVLSCGMGGGHDSAARAVNEELQSRGIETELLNPYTLQSERLADTINRTYIKMVQHFPAAFGMVYAAGQAIRKLPGRSPVYHFNRGMALVMESYLAEQSFDFAVTSHLFPAEILTYMREHKMSVPRFAFIATDYVCIPFTEDSACDAYFIPTSEQEESFTERDIERKLLHPFGIPVSRAFSEPMEKGKARELLQLSPDKRYVFIAGGSVGVKSIHRAIDALSAELSENPEVQILAVCGSNRSLYEELRDKYDSRVIILEYTDKMALYLKACDLYITKPGGLSTTEAAASRIPMLLLPPIPGCETYNAEFFLSHGMAERFDPFQDTHPQVKRLLFDSDARKQMLTAQRSHINPFAARDICDFLLRTFSV